MLEVQWVTLNHYDYNYGMDPQQVQSIFVLSLDKLDQISKM